MIAQKDGRWKGFRAMVLTVNELLAALDANPALLEAARAMRFGL